MGGKILSGEKLLINIMIGCLILLIGLIVAYLVISKKQASRLVINKKVTTRQHRYEKFLSQFYIQLTQFHLGKIIVLRIRQRFSLTSMYKEEEIRQKTAQALLIILSCSVVLLSVVIMTAKSIISVIVFMGIMYLTSRSIIDIFILKIRKKILLDQVQLNKAIRLKYYETGLVDDSIELASDSLMSEGKFEIARQGYKIVDVLRAKDKEQEIYEYNEAAPNKYLKLLLGLSYMTQSYGDNKVNEISAYTYSLKLLNQEIRMEYEKKDKVGYIFKAVDIFILLPLLATNFAISWLSNMFFDLEIYFNSTIGILTNIFMYLIVIVSYYVLQRSQQDTDDKVIRTKKDMKIVPFFRNITLGIKPMRYTTKYFKLERKLKEAKESRNVEQFYYKKLLWAIAGLLVSIVIIIIIHQMAINNVFTMPSVKYIGKSLNVGAFTDEELEAADEITDFDSSIINELQKKSKYRQSNKNLEEENNMTIEAEEEVKAYLEKTSDKDYEEVEIKAITERVLTKIETVNNEYFKWYEYLLSIFIGLLSYFIPNIDLEIRRRIYLAEEDDEVNLFNSLILMLINTHGVDAYEVLVWLQRFSRIFKEELEASIVTFDAGAEQSIERLKESIENSNFRELLDNLQRAATSLTLKEAFDELLGDKEYFYEKRKEDNERLIFRNKNIASMLTMVPISALIILYLVIPVLYVAFQGFNNINLTNL